MFLSALFYGPLASTLRNAKFAKQIEPLHPVIKPQDYLVPVLESATLEVHIVRLTLLGASLRLNHRPLAIQG